MKRWLLPLAVLALVLAFFAHYGVHCREHARTQEPPVQPQGAAHEPDDPKLERAWRILEDMLAAGREINLDILPIPGSTNLPRRTAVAAKHCDPFQDKPPNPGPGETVELVPDLFRWQGEVEFDPAGTPEPEVWFRGDMCVRPLLPDEIKVAYSNATAAGTGWIIVTGTDRFTGTVRLPYRIAPRKIMANCPGFDGEYDGKGHGVSIEFFEPVERPRFSYSLSETGPFSPSPILKTNVQDRFSRVFVRIEADNYEPLVIGSEVVIHRRCIWDHVDLTVSTNAVPCCGPGSGPVFSLRDRELGPLTDDSYELVLFNTDHMRHGFARVDGKNNYDGDFQFEFEVFPAQH